MLTGSSDGNGKRSLSCHWVVALPFGLWSHLGLIQVSRALRVVSACGCLHLKDLLSLEVLEWFA